MPKIQDIAIDRIYSCENEACCAIIQITQKATDPFEKKCPFCGKESLVLKEAKCSIQGFVDTSKPKTLGSIAEKNRTKMEKNGDITKGEAESWTGKKKNKSKPFWRKSDKIDFSILKNPKKYIETGKV